MGLIGVRGSALFASFPTALEAFLFFFLSDLGLDSAWGNSLQIGRATQASRFLF
jgi:hypothetical protein